MKIEKIIKSDDGIEFSSEEACLEYEKNKKEQKTFNEYLQNLLKNSRIGSFDSTGAKTIYKITSKSDFDTIVNWYCSPTEGKECYSEDNKYYIFEYQEYCDDSDTLIIKSLSEEIKELENLLETYKKIF